MRTVLMQAFGLETLSGSEQAERIRHLQTEFPASAALHLLGLMHAELPATHNEAIYFSNPLWLQHLLAHEQTETSRAEPSVPPQAKEHKPEPTALNPESIAEEAAEPQPGDGEPQEEEEEEESQKEQAALPVDRLRNMLATQAAALAQPATPQDLLPIEPHHATDYFASLGAKQKPVINAIPVLQPELVKKVHTFTEWLKQMKRNNYAQAGAAVTPQQEAQVAMQAQKSNTMDDVITEAMAEVYLKQGRPDQAKLIYQKLMETDASKSAYFAAQLEKII